MQDGDVIVPFVKAIILLDLLNEDAVEDFLFMELKKRIEVGLIYLVSVLQAEFRLGEVIADDLILSEEIVFIIDEGS